MCVFLFLCLFKFFPVWAAEGRPDEGGGLHSKEVAPGFAAVLLRSQRAAVSQKNSYAWADARLHSCTGTQQLLACRVLNSEILKVRVQTYLWVWSMWLSFWMVFSVTLRTIFSLFVCCRLASLRKASSSCQRRWTVFSILCPTWRKSKVIYIYFQVF